MEPKQKQYPVVNGTGDRGKVQCCKEPYCIGTWNVRSMNQGKLEVVKQEMARVNIDILGVSQLKWTVISSDQSLSHVRLCDPMNHSTPGLPVHHQLPEFTQTHVHWVGDAIQPSHPLIPFSSRLQSFPASGSFPNESVLRIRWPKDWSFSFSISPSNECSRLIFFRMI